jgi:hypothetical protein
MFGWQISREGKILKKEYKKAQTALKWLGYGQTAGFGERDKDLCRRLGYYYL